MGLDHKLFLQLYLIDLCLFCCKIGKMISIEISLNLRFLLDDQHDLPFTLPGNP